MPDQLRLLIIHCYPWLLLKYFDLLVGSYEKFTASPRVARSAVGGSPPAVGAAARHTERALRVECGIRSVEELCQCLEREAHREEWAVWLLAMVQGAGVPLPRARA